MAASSQKVSDQEKKEDLKSSKLQRLEQRNGFKESIPRAIARSQCMSVRCSNVPRILRRPRQQAALPAEVQSAWAIMVSSRVATTIYQDYVSKITNKQMLPSPNHHLETVKKYQMKTANKFNENALGH